MQGHEKHPVILRIHAVNIGHQRHLFQKLAQGGVVMAVLISHHLAYQLVDILDTILRILLVRFLKLLHIARGFDNIVHQLLQAVIFQLAAEGLDHHYKGLQLCRAFSDAQNLIGFPERIIEAESPGVRIFLHTQDGGCADSPPGNIDDALYRQIVPPVVNGLKICQHVLDFPARVEINPAHHIVGNAFHNKTFFQNTGLCVGAVKNRAVPEFRFPVFFFFPISPAMNSASS